MKPCIKNLAISLKFFWGVLAIENLTKALDFNHSLLMGTWFLCLAVVPVLLVGSP